MAPTRVRYGRLSADAREVIRMCGVSPADYVRWRSPGGHWFGDRCGCPDDRCIGYHHDEDEQCGLLERHYRLVGETIAGEFAPPRTAP